MTISDGVVIATVVLLPVLGFASGAWALWWFVKDILYDMRKQVGLLVAAYEKESKSIAEAAARVYEHAVGEPTDESPGPRRAEPQAGPLGLPGPVTPGVTVAFDDEIVDGELVDTRDIPLLEPKTTRVVEVRQGTYVPEVPTAVPSLAEPLVEFIENLDSHVVHDPTCGLVPKGPASGKFLNMWQMTRGELAEMLNEPTSKMRACKQCRPDRVRERV